MLMIKRLMVVLGALALAAACTPMDWNGGDGGPVVARNTPRPIPQPRPKPVTNSQKPTAPAKAAAKAPAQVESGNSVRVRKGDTVYGLSRRYGLSPRDIVVANRLRPPYRLTVGQRLTIPRARVYTVRKGDTGYAISRRFGIDLTELTRLNKLRRPYRLNVGQKLKLPPGATGQAAPEKIVASKSRPPEKAPPPRAGSGFSWPVRGTIVSRFGPKKGGLHNDGINIRVTRQQPIRSAENGVVAYAGNQLRGFGNLILVRHAGGWVTAYAHNDTILVAKNERVARGQIIARAGSTGNVTTPQLHFELRKGTRAVDPLRYLPRLSAGATP